MKTQSVYFDGCYFFIKKKEIDLNVLSFFEKGDEYRYIFNLFFLNKLCNCHFLKRGFRC